MSERAEAVAAVSRAGKRAAYHLLKAAVEGLKAVEAVIEEIGAIGEESREHDETVPHQRIEIE